MLKAIAWKESREVLPLAALAFISQGLYLLAIRLPFLNGYRDTGTIPFLDDGFSTWMLLIGGALAVALGFWQTSGEQVRGTFPYLLHRPIERTSIFAVKLVVGASFILLISGLPILVYALWAASPAAHASPFFWSMTNDAWLQWSRLPLVYLGAFLSGLRPRRWLGSRGLPLAASLLAFFGVFILGVWPWLALLVGLLLEAWFVLTIFFVTTSRDFS